MAAAPSQLGKRALLAGAAGLLLAGLPGCQSITVNAGNVAQVRVVDASPQSNGLDFYESNNALAYNLGFGTNTSYVPISPGTYTLTADATGTRQVLASASATLSAARQYTVIVGNVPANMQAVVLQDQTQPAPTGHVAVRILDWTTRTGAVDVYMVPSGGSITTTSPVATNVSFQGNTGYIDVPAGTYALAVVPAGTVPVSSTTTLLTGSQRYYGTGSVHTVVLIDQQIVTVPGVQAIILDDYESPTTQG